MIFIAKNEDGTPSWELVLLRKKIVTRRLKPMAIGKEFAIQPGRGKKAICRAKVLSCENSAEHAAKRPIWITMKSYYAREAHLEGFKSWNGLIKFFEDRKIHLIDTYRIKFEVI